MQEQLFYKLLLLDGKWHWYYGIFNLVEITNSYVVICYPDLKFMIFNILFRGLEGSLPLVISMIYELISYIIFWQITF